MTTKKYALPDKVAAIALKYGYNVSRGIQKMDEIISRNSTRVEDEDVHGA